MSDRASKGGRDDLRATATEVLQNFESIAAAALAGLGERGRRLDDLAAVNLATAENVARNMQVHNLDRVDNLQRLVREPAIARLVVADENEQQEVIYISSGGTVDRNKVRLCSYLSPKGALAELNVGDGAEITLPEGRRYFDLIEKVTFKPVFQASGWDAVPAVSHQNGAPPLTIRSLRDLLLDAGVDEDEVDAVTAWLAGDRDGSEDDNVLEGLRRETLTAMELRVAPILNKFQGEIFRLPLDTQIAILGAPGTGKTTTLVKRLRQKIDMAVLQSTGEHALVDAQGSDQLDHVNSWIVFSPTELLRLYVGEALGAEGVAVSDARLWTWDTYRRFIGRELRILRPGSTGGGLVLRESETMLNPDTITQQIAWFEAFDQWQQAFFVGQLATEAERLAQAADARAAQLGIQIGAAIARSSTMPLRLLGDLVGLSARLRAVSDAGREETRAALRTPLFDYARPDPMFLPDLAAFVDGLNADETDDIDDEEGDGEEDEANDRARTLRGNHLAEEVFIRAMRARAIAQASGRTPNPQSRAGKLLGWLRARALTLPDLREVGSALLVQRAALRLSRATGDYLSRMPSRYRRFRREQRKWYAATPGRPDHATGAEIDVILLATLRTCEAIANDRLLSSRLGDRPPALLRDVARLRRNQVLVDEATDFSPIQLACMCSLPSERTQSIFLSGDFNQRMTRWGVRSERELRWVSPRLDVRTIEIGYRQSRRLAEFAGALGRLQGKTIDERAPEYLDNVGFPPVAGFSLASTDVQVAWLDARIREIDGITGSPLPTIAILVADATGMEALAEGLSIALEDMNIRAVGCPKGQVKGNKGDVRIFEIEHIKGLEFEAVFLLDVDQLQQSAPASFDQYVYVGATRAASFLALGFRSAELPDVLAPLLEQLAAHW